MADCPFNSSVSSVISFTHSVSQPQSLPHVSPQLRELELDQEITTVSLSVLSTRYHGRRTVIVCCVFVVFTVT